MTNRYKNSNHLLERALEVIPLGSQTFSKSKTQYPYGVSPYFIEKGQGSRVWDVDGNEYIDFVSGLGAITLGYNDPDVINAVREQLEIGSIFSLPHKKEIHLAEKIIDMVPCAEMVRFGKNGSDATSVAIRLARAYTHRDRVAVCGYHGWQDWYIGSTSRNLGVPKAVCDLTHPFKYNDIDSLEQVLNQYPGEFAAVILEPMSGNYPLNNFLENVKDLAYQNGAVLIFDEVVTGFRYANGGAQEFFNVIPDLATFGKGLANGFPISAIAGRKEIMLLMEEIFYSFTFGGEILSLSASIATLNKLQNKPILGKIYSQGQKIIHGVKELLNTHQIADIIEIIGHPSHSSLVFKNAGIYTQWEIKTLMLQELFAKGILTIGSHNLSYAHDDQDISTLLNTYNEVFGMIKNVVQNKSLKKYLLCEPLSPLFKIR